MNLNLDAKLEFGAENKFYMPHTSLIYDEFPMEKREKIMKEIQISQMKFTASKIVVVSGNKDPKTWKK